MNFSNHHLWNILLRGFYFKYKILKLQEKFSKFEHQKCSRWKCVLIIHGVVSYLSWGYSHTQSINSGLSFHSVDLKMNNLIKRKSKLHQISSVLYYTLLWRL